MEEEVDHPSHWPVHMAFQLETDAEEETMQQLQDNTDGSEPPTAPHVAPPPTVGSPTAPSEPPPPPPPPPPTTTTTSHVHHSVCISTANGYRDGNSWEAQVEHADAIATGVGTIALGAHGSRESLARSSSRGLQLHLPMTQPTRANPTPGPKGAYVWVPAIWGCIGLQTQRDAELAKRTGMTMRWNEQHMLEFNFTGVHDARGEYLCRYVRAVCRRLGLPVTLADWNALRRYLSDAKAWPVGSGTLHNVRLFREAQRGGRPLSSGGLCYQERHWADPSYYQPWDAGGSRPAPKTKEIDSGQGGQGGLPGATMNLAALLAQQLERGCSWHGVAIPAKPRLFEDARRDADFLDTDDAIALAQKRWKHANKPNLGSVKAVPEQHRATVEALKNAGDQLVRAGEFSDAAGKYQEAYTLHPSSQTLGKMVQHAKQAAATISIVEAQLNAHGGEMSWDQFVVNYWTASPDRTHRETESPPSQNAAEVGDSDHSHSPGQVPSPRLASDGSEDEWDMDAPTPADSSVDMELSSGEVLGLPMPEEDQAAPPLMATSGSETTSFGSLPPILELSDLLPPAAAAVVGQDQEQEDLEQTLSNSLGRVSIEQQPSPESSVVEWVVYVEEGYGCMRGWKACVLQITTGTATMRLCEPRDAGGCNNGQVIVEKSLAGCRVTSLKDPRNQHGNKKCSPEQSARKIEFADKSSYKLVADSGGNDSVWHSGSNRELFQTVERLSHWVPPLHGARRRDHRSSRDTDRRRHSHGRAASPPRRVSCDDGHLERCRSDRSDRSSCSMESDGLASRLAPPPLRTSLDDLPRRLAV